MLCPSNLAMRLSSFQALPKGPTGSGPSHGFVNRFGYVVPMFGRFLQGTASVARPPLLWPKVSHSFVPKSAKEES